MPVDSLSLGGVRGSGSATRIMSVGGQGQVFSQDLLPQYAQLVAEGRVWRVQEASATASVVALPTTASLFTVGNNEPDDGLWYVGIAAYAFNSANAAALDVWSLACCISQNVSTSGGTDPTLTQDIARTSVKNMLGARGGAYSGRAVVDTGVTITDDLWFPLCNSSGSTAINSGTGSSIFHWFNGLVVLPPKAVIGFVSTATSTSNTTRKGFVWAEVPKSWLLPTNG